MCRIKQLTGGGASFWKASGGVLSVDSLFDYWRSLSVVRPL
jgi:hypothetical protein